MLIVQCFTAIQKLKKGCKSKWAGGTIAVVHRSLPCSCIFHPKATFFTRCLQVELLSCRSFWQKRQFLLSLFLHCAFLMQDFPLIYIIKKDCRVPRIWCLRLRSGTPPLLAKTNPNKTTPIFAATERAFPAISSLMFLYLHFPFKQIFFFSCQAGRNMEGGWISHESLKQKKGGNKTQPERKR